MCGGKKDEKEVGEGVEWIGLKKELLCWVLVGDGKFEKRKVK